MKVGGAEIGLRGEGNLGEDSDFPDLHMSATLIQDLLETKGEWKYCQDPIFPPLGCLLLSWACGTGRWQVLSPKSSTLTRKCYPFFRVWIRHI